MSTTLSVRLPDKLAKELSNMATTTERSKSFLVQKAIEGYLQNQTDLQVSLDRLRDTADPIISVDVIREEIGL